MADDPFHLVLERLGPRVRHRRDRHANGHCPAYHDVTASLSVSRSPSGAVLLKCFAGCSVEAILDCLSPAVRDLFLRGGRAFDKTARHVTSLTALEFSALAARVTWGLERDLARDDTPIDLASDVLRYFARRDLLAAGDDGNAAALHSSLERRLPAAIRSWPRHGYPIVAPLYSATTGALQAVQARRTVPGEAKTVFPKGAGGRGRVLASPAGCRLRFSQPVAQDDPDLAILGEGLTDFLALAVAAPGDVVPVLTVAGVAAAPGISLRHLRRLVTAGRMSQPIRLGAAVRWSRAELESWVARRCADPTKIPRPSHRCAKSKKNF